MRHKNYCIVLCIVTSKMNASITKNDKNSSFAEILLAFSAKIHCFLSVSNVEYNVVVYYKLAEGLFGLRLTRTDQTFWHEMLA